MKKKSRETGDRERRRTKIRKHMRRRRRRRRERQRGINICRKTNNTSVPSRFPEVDEKEGDKEET